jgi:hypothetical protein
MSNDHILAAVGWTTVLQAWAWPLVILIVVLAFLIWVSASTAALPMLKIVFGRVRRVSAFGVEFDLTQKAAQQTQTNVEAGFGELRQRLNRKFDSYVDEEQLNSKLLTIVSLAVHPALTDEAKKSYRCTVHVPDVLFQDSLLQLLDYQPSGGGRGRAFSARFGIIGKCWRSGEPDIQSDVATHAVELIKEWAMTTAEALDVGHGRSSFAAVPLFDKHKQPVGVLYVDALPKDAWSTPQEAGKKTSHDHPLCQEIAKHAHEVGLVDSLVTIMGHMRKTGPRIRLYK